MIGRETRGFVEHFARAYPCRTALMVALLLLSGLAEGVGIAALLPVLRVAVGEASADDPISSAVVALGLEPTLELLLALIVVAIGLKGLFRWLAMREVGHTLSRVAKEMRQRLLRALMRVRWIYFTSQPAGHFANAVGSEALRASQAYKAACGGLAAMIQAAVYAGIIVVISWHIALLGVIAGAVVAAGLRGFVAVSRQAGRDQTNIMKGLIAQLTDALRGIKSIKAMGREDRLFRVLQEETERLEDAEKRHVTAREALQSFHEPIIVLLLAAVLYVALTWWQLGLSTVLVMAFLFYRLTGRFQNVQQQYQGLVVGESAFWSLDDMTANAEAQREENPGQRTPPLLREGLIFDSVSFAYEDESVLDDVTCQIPAGSFCALTGASGAGKTTFVDLLIGLHTPDHGEIRVDGIPLTEIDLERWRHSIGYVPQETLLFHDSVYRNVTLGSVEFEEAVVEEALRRADAWNFVERLSHGMHTEIGEGGSKLSGGQRQRIAIARAILDSPRLLILDEATTALDPQTERAICETLGQLAGEVTVIAISHQQALRGIANQILEVRGGEIRSAPQLETA